MNWKILAIVLGILFILENLIIGYGTYLVIMEEKETNDCYYNFCADYPEARYLDGVCECYDHDMLGELVLRDTRYKR